MEKEKKQQYNPRDTYIMYAFGIILQEGEMAEDIVRMISQYVERGWMDFEQATLMLKSVFEPDEKQ